MKTLEGRWMRKCGFPRVTIYQPGGHIEKYMTKAITPEFCEIRFSSKLSLPPFAPVADRSVEERVWSS